MRTRSREVVQLYWLYLFFLCQRKSSSRVLCWVLLEFQRRSTTRSPFHLLDEKVTQRAAKLEQAHLQLTESWPENKADHVHVWAGQRDEYLAISRWPNPLLFGEGICVCAWERVWFLTFLVKCNCRFALVVKLATCSHYATLQGHLLAFLVRLPACLLFKSQESHLFDLFQFLTDGYCSTFKRILLLLLFRSYKMTVRSYHLWKRHKSKLGYRKFYFLNIITRWWILKFCP